MDREREIIKLRRGELEAKQQQAKKEQATAEEEVKRARASKRQRTIKNFQPVPTLYRAKLIDNILSRSTLSISKYDGRLTTDSSVSPTTTITWFQKSDFLFLLKIAAIHPAILCDIADESIGHVIASLIWY
jgi:hypothetical protein